MKRNILLLSFVVLLVQLARAGSDARLGVTAVVRIDADIEHVAASADSFYLVLSNGTLLTVNDRGTIGARSILKDRPLRVIISDYLNALIVVFGDRAEIRDPRTLEVLTTLYLLEEDEEFIEMAEIWKDLIVLVIRYRSDGNHLDRLVFFNITTSKRVFERDVSSTDRLARVFYIHVVRDNLIVHSLNVLCKLCELTDALLEVYDLRTLTKRAVYAIGLSHISCHGDVVAALRKARVRDQYMLFVLNLTGERTHTIWLGRITSSFYLTNKYIVLWYHDAHILKILTYEGDTVLSRRVEGTPLGTYGDWLVITRGPKVTIETIGGRVLFQGYLPLLARSAHFNEQSGILLCGDGSVALISRMRMCRLLVSVTIDGRPVESVPVEILSNGTTLAKGLTNASGVFVAEGVRASGVTVRVKYGERTLVRSVAVICPATRVSFDLSGYTKLNNLTVIVVDDTGRPVPEVKVLAYDMRSGREYSAVTDSEGRAVMRGLPLSVYRFTIASDEFSQPQLIVDLNASSRVVEMVVKRLKFNVTLTLEGNLSRVVKVWLVGGGDNVVIYPTEIIGDIYTFVNLKRGKYIVNILLINGSVITKEIHVHPSEGLNIRIRIPEWPVRALETRNGGPAIVDEVRAFLSKRLVYVGEGRINLASLPPAVTINNSLLPLRPSKGGILVLNFFFMKCSGCESIYPILAELRKRFPQVRIVSLTVSPYDRPYDLRRYALEHNITWELGIDMNGVYDKFNVTHFPTIVLLTGEGKYLKFMGIGGTGGLHPLESYLHEVACIVKGERGKGLLLMILGFMIFVYAATRMRRYT